MKSVIFVACDERYGGFLIENWLSSLQDNADLTNIELIVLDYGLSKKQISKLKQRNVLVHKCKRDGHVNVIRFRDIAKILRKKKYDQVLSTDGGDLIFQTSIKELLEKDKRIFRACYEDMNPPFGVYIKSCFSKEDAKKIKETLKGKGMINAGMIVAPQKLFKKMCDESYNMIEKRTFGPDQVAINYILHRDGFKRLHQKYNFVVTTSRIPFKIKEGKFYINGNQLIPIVHNAGGKDFLRPIKNFGYGEGKNKLKFFRYLILRTLIKISSPKRETNNQ